MNTITREAYEGDIVSRLRNWRGLHLSHGGRLYEEAAGEIERLRLNDDERMAIWLASDDYLHHPDQCDRVQWIRQALLGLLGRLRSGEIENTQDQRQR